MSQRILVTAALPYANGSLHMGHLVEYCLTDMYVRALKRLGEEAYFFCADDAHGTPIEVNAKRQGIAPETLVQGYHNEHKRDFARFDVHFDHYTITHSDTNRTLVEQVFQTLQAKGCLEERTVPGNWCPKDERFLPDRFMKGTCPRCKAADQYGDVCESCGATYAPTELLEPRCALCGTTPVQKDSQHYFFKLDTPERVASLRSFVDGGALQPDVANYVRNWIDGGLRDWCISRDGPYFGFAIPDRPDKFFYVWLDAPLGYIAASQEWAAQHGVSLDDLWSSPNTRIEHVIGKDIVYFHTLFWPAVLQAAGFSMPSKIHVHGMLTVNGEKMSKSRGTFINAADFAEHVDPQALRYYYAAKLNSHTDDLDLSMEDFVHRINSELVNKHANLFSRAAQFLNSRLDGQLGDLPFAAAEAQAAPTEGDDSLLGLAQRVVQHCRQAEAFYRQREFGQAIREITQVAEIGNEYMQAQKPWDQIKSDPEAARLTCTFALNVCYALAMYLWPVVPRFCAQAAQILNADITRMDPAKLFAERNRRIGPMERLFDRVDLKQLETLMEATKQRFEETQAAPENPAAAIEPIRDVIVWDDFEKLDLRVGHIREAEQIPKSKKLLKLQVDLGEGKMRQIIAGLALHYKPEELLDTSVVVVANLKPAKLMGHLSEGMILAAGSDALAVLRPDRDSTPGATVR